MLSIVMCKRDLYFMRRNKTHTYLSDTLLSFSFMTRKNKRYMLMLCDFIALTVALWAGFAIRLSEWWPSTYLEETAWFFVVVPIIGVVSFYIFGFYRAVVRYMNFSSFWGLLYGVLISAAFLLLVDTLLQYSLFPRSVSITFALAALVFVGGNRFLITNLYRWLQHHYVDKDSVIIYGAGAAGVQLAAALLDGREYYPLAFVDDDKSLQGGRVAGIKVFSTASIGEIIEMGGVTDILLAIPSASHKLKKQILDKLEIFPVHVKTLPSVEEIMAGKVDPTQLREVELEDLLGRDSIPPRKELLDISIKGKVVMVTGAGGSIGSELCRQVMYAKPKSIVLYELSEFAVYQIEQSLQQLMVQLHITIPVYALLGSVCDKSRVAEVIQRFGVQSIYHAAAYKHVPIVEQNVLAGINNNVFGTLTVALLAKKYHVERFVLVSTDKAVRPTNVMGATKRLAELVLQDLAVDSPSTVFSMVRFGNVLGSSGSVVPLFRRQISEGGPLTVTHPNITRFFMTIPEAASLVVQAGSMGQGGDVFVLDMGAPVKISDLAERMIRLSGLEPKDENNPEGDIEIHYTGLRSGEKLYEELLIGDDVVATSHPKIMRAHEEMLTAPQLQCLLDRLKSAVETGNSRAGRDALQESIKGFSPSSALVDLLAEEVVLH